MTPRQVALVQRSWTLVQPIADKAAELFYMRLFSLEPSVRRLFSGDMARLAQGIGEKFTGGTDEAWRTAYRVLANTMQSNTAQGERIGAALKPILEA
jgi:hemoglobin-like flavoprotein